jgi:hypothetical protein
VKAARPLELPITDAQTLGAGGGGEDQRLLLTATSRIVRELGI